MASIIDLNGRKYEYEYTLKNKDGELKLSDSAVDYLEIVDSLFFPFTSGTIVIADQFNATQRDFMYRGDGSDKLILKLKIQPTSADDKERELDFNFRLTHETNIVDKAGTSGNSKAFDFIEETEALLKVQYVYNAAGKNKAKDIIIEIMKKYGKADVTSKVGNESWEIDTLPEAVIPGGNYRAIDFLYYMLKYSWVKLADIFERMILIKPLDGKRGDDYELTTLSEIFKTQKVTDAFTSSDIAEKLVPNPNNPPTDAPYRPYANNLTSYNFSAPSMSINNTFYQNILVSGYDHILGASKIKRIDLIEYVDKWKKHFCKKIKYASGTGNHHINMTKEKLDGQFKTYSLPFKFEDSVKMVQADLTSNLILTNLQLTFNVTGDLRRRPGTFVDIFKTKNENNKIDKKILGRWFVTTVIHRKIRQTYTNEIVCNKGNASPRYKNTIENIEG